MTMKYNTFIPATFNQEELDQRVKAKQARLAPSKDFQSNSFADALKQIESLTAAGWKLDLKGSTPLALPLVGMIDFQWLMLKPAKLIKSELAAIAVKVESEYRQELETEQQLAVEKMTARLLGEARDKQAKEQATLEEQATLDAIAQAKQILGVTN
ncbi:hypothetical protein ACIGCM_01325 [Pseudomonas sp. NPDC078700]|uniref:hypothetical protein n=1 Tax=Pseudomonas sp. NPDC078700 TaxID=3364424 RepID=UPI0037CC5279